jgi:hypothetical protein
MAISVGFVDAAHAGPEFMVAHPGGGKGCPFTAVGPIPFVCRHDLGRVGSILQHIIRARLAAFGDVLYFCMDRDQRLATGNETVGA